MRVATVHGQDILDDLAAVLRLGRMPHLRYLWLGSLDCEHCFGQRFDSGTIAQRGLHIDDCELLEQLRPTAALWWMAERALHVRCSKLHQFRYELEHGADARSTVGAFTLLEWMRIRLAAQQHSSTGLRAVSRLLVKHGAAATAESSSLPTTASDVEGESLSSSEEEPEERGDDEEDPHGDDTAEEEEDWQQMDQMALHDVPLPATWPAPWPASLPAAPPGYYGTRVAHALDNDSSSE